MTGFAPNAPLALLSRVATRIGHIHEVWRARRRLAHELALASDRELGELGFSRADIGDIARGTYLR